MTKYDWKHNIKGNILTLKIVGLWPPGEGDYRPDLYTIYAVFMLAIFLIIHMLFQAVNIYFIRTDLRAVAANVYVLLVEVVVVIKVQFVVAKIGMLKELLRILDTEMFQPKNSSQIGEIRASIHFWAIIYKSLLSVCFGANLFWALYPLLDKSGSDERRLPFLAWYPFDTTVSPMYELTYFYQVFSTSYITAVHINIDALLVALNIFNGSQFDILCDNLRHLHQLGESISENFIYCVKHHKEILSFSDRSNKFLNWVLATQFIIFAICIGMTLFQLTMVKPMTNEFFSLVAYGSAISTQVFMYCWFGNEVEVKSGNIPYAVFESDWTDLTLELKKKFLFLMLSAAKPVRLSAFNLFYLSLENFLRMLKTSYSYFALLNQVNSGP